MICGERTYAAVDIDAIRYNIGLVREKVGDRKIILVVKADAYGHGASKVALLCSDIVDEFAVATVEEGVKLRRCGAVLPITVLGNTVREKFAGLIDYDLRACVFSQDSAYKLNCFCKKLGVKARAYIAMDSGMGRIGFLPDEVDGAVEAASMSNLIIDGIFTHFACADCADKSYTLAQQRVFNKFIEELRGRGVSLGCEHSANSAALMEQKDITGNAVRMGIMAYGLYPSTETGSNWRLKEAMSWHTRIVHIKTLPIGASVSYGAVFTAKRITRVATLPIGYADGYPRALSDKGCVLIRGRRAPIIGRVCMDQTMVDVTDIRQAEIDDEVTLIGAMGEERIGAEELGAKSGSFNYEIVCGIGARVPRYFVQDGRIVGRYCLTD